MIISAPMLEVITMIALRKSTLWPRASERWPSSMICRSMFVRFGVGLFDLIEDDDRIRMAADGLGELAGLFVADVAGRSAHQAADRVAFHELGHIELDQGFFAAEQEARQRFGQLGLAHAGRAKEDEGADRAARVFEAGACAADGLGDGLDGFFLPDDMLAAARLPSAAGGSILPGPSASPARRSTWRPLRRYRPRSPPGCCCVSQPVRRRSSCVPD